MIRRLIRSLAFWTAFVFIVLSMFTGCVHVPSEVWRWSATLTAIDLGVNLAAYAVVQGTPVDVQKQRDVKENGY